jgi:hypothetical protein
MSLGILENGLQGLVTIWLLGVWASGALSIEFS